MQIEFITPASQEFLAAIDFYEVQAPGLGEEFILDVESSLKLIADFPIHLYTGRKQICSGLLQSSTSGDDLDFGWIESRCAGPPGKIRYVKSPSYGVATIR